MSHDDFDFEPTPGLPAELPAGETLLWQGVPNWKSLAVRAYQVRKVAVYFAILVVWRAGVGIGNAQGVATVLLGCAFIALLGVIVIGMLSTLAYFSARSTVYSITSRRVMLRHGVAVPMTMNLPFKQIEAAALRGFADGTGDIALTLPASERIGFLITWPHVRPGRFKRPEPSLRALPDAQRAAEILSTALALEAGQTASRAEAPAAQGVDAPGTEAPGVQAPGIDAPTAGPRLIRPRTPAAA